MKKLLVLILIFFVALSTGTVTFAEPMVSEKLPAYGSYTGIVKNILPSDRSVDAVQRVEVEDEKGGECVFLIDKDTFWASDVTSVKVGDRVTGFYDATKPMILIYPPQYNIEIMVVNLDELMGVTVDRFDNRLFSSFGALQISIGEHTQVLSQSGQQFSDEAGFAGRLLVVMHDLSDGSKPAKVMAWTIYVMDEKAVPLKEKDEIVDVAGMDIIVNGKKIDAPSAYNKDDAVMVPLRAVAEALDFKVQWEGATRSVMLNNSISLKIGSDYYTFARMAPVELGTAPELKDNKTFVPLNFFTDLARMNNAYIFEGQIVIDNFEKME